MYVRVCVFASCNIFQSVGIMFYKDAHSNAYFIFKLQILLLSFTSYIFCLKALSKSEYTKVTFKGETDKVRII